MDVDSVFGLRFSLGLRCVGEDFQRKKRKCLEWPRRLPIRNLDVICWGRGLVKVSMDCPFQKRIWRIPPQVRGPCYHSTCKRVGETDT
jgi:hypothetical protein